MRRKLIAFFDVRPGEWARVLLLSAYFFLIITSYYVIKSVRNSLFIERLGADSLPYVYILAALVVGGISVGYSRIAERVSRRKLVLGTLVFLASNLAVFWWVLRAEALLTSGAFYLWARLYPLLLVSQFWLVANEFFTTPQAKRLFGIIGAGGIAGGIAGSSIAGAFATRLGSENLLLVTILILALAALFMLVTDRVAEPVRASAAAADKRPGSGAWRALRDSTHLRTIAYILLLMIVVESVVDWQFNRAVELFVPGEDAKTAFYGGFFAVLNGASFVIQLMLTSWVLRVLGVGVALLLLPMAVLTGSIGIIAHPGLWSAVFTKGAEGSLRYSLDQSTRELLFLPLPSDIKYSGKPLVDLVVYRGGTGIGGIILLIGTKGFGFGLREMAIVAVALLALWIGVALSMRREYRASVRELIRTRDVEADELIVQHLDAAAHGELAEALESDDENAVLYALSLLEGVDGEQVVEKADHLLRHPSDRVRARTLRILYDVDTGERLDAVQRLLSDPSIEVRLEAVHFVCAFGPQPAAETMQGFLDSTEPEVRAAAAACMAQHGGPGQVEEAARHLREMAAARNGAGAVKQRRLAAEALAALDGRARVDDTMISLLHDREPSVIRAAIQSAARTHRRELVPHVLSHLCCPGTRPTARSALASFGTGILPELEETMRDPRVPPEIRKSIPAIFYETPTQTAVERLSRLLGQVGPGLRYYVLKSLNRMRRNYDGLEFDGEALEPILHTELRQGYQFAADRAAVPPGGLLAQALGECQAQALERVTRVLGLLYPQEEILAAYQGLTSDTQTMRSAGFELLESTLSVAHRRLVGPLADPHLASRERALRGAAFLDGVRLEDEAAVLNRLARTGAEPWVAAVAAAATGGGPELFRTPVSPEPPFHRHALPRVGLTLDDMLTRDRESMLKLVERADFLRDVDIFSDVHTEDLARVAAIAREREYDEGEALFHEGDEGSEMFLIVSGQVRATREGETVFIAERRETVGTLALIDSRPREFTAMATRYTRTLVITREDFFDLMHDYFALAEGLLTHLARVVRKLNQRLEPEKLGT